jgi:hypothetical protein
VADRSVGTGVEVIGGPGVGVGVAKVNVGRGVDFIPGFGLGKSAIVGASSAFGGPSTLVRATGVGVPGTKVCSVDMSGFIRGSGWAQPISANINDAHVINGKIGFPIRNIKHLRE